MNLSRLIAPAALVVLSSVAWSAAGTGALDVLETFVADAREAAEGELDKKTTKSYAKIDKLLAKLEKKDALSFELKSAATAAKLLAKLNKEDPADAQEVARQILLGSTEFPLGIAILHTRYQQENGVAAARLPLGKLIAYGKALNPINKATTRYTDAVEEGDFVSALKHMAKAQKLAEKLRRRFKLRIAT